VAGTTKGPVAELRLADLPSTAWSPHPSAALLLYARGTRWTKGWTSAAAVSRRSASRVRLLRRPAKNVSPRLWQRSRHFVSSWRGALRDRDAPVFGGAGRVAAEGW